VQIEVAYHGGDLHGKAEANKGNNIPGLEALAKADLVIEAAVEDEAVKKSILAELVPHLGPDTLLASNTSSGTPRSASRDPPHPRRPESRRDQLPGPSLADHTRRNQTGDHRPTARKLPRHIPPAYATSTAVARHPRDRKSTRLNSSHR
jgi:hypothetical protein